ncbi:glycosyl hydrolase [Marinoscillum sp.]|uniref:glycosyl hydrolase n=1 Tax=Marinoscillum sp. TaxID=2024838 RepID=UPI003BAA46BD
MILLFFFSSHGQQKSEKRGLGYGYHSQKDLEVLAPGVSWWYNWFYMPDEGVRDTYQQSGVAYVPMAWNGNFNKSETIRFLESHPEVEFLLGFNEPNFKDQANMTPSQAAAMWPELEELATRFDLKLIGPAVNYCGNCVSENGTTYSDPIVYLDDFFAACQGCQVDYVAIHWYGCGGFDWYLDLFKKYNRPIWVTEIACWDQDNISEDQQKSYLINVVDQMENDPDVFRYAWFVGRGDGPHISLLAGDGELTELGQLYVNMPVHDPADFVTLPTRIEAEYYQTMLGIQLELTQDETGLMNVGYLDAGDSLSYHLEVPDDRWYTFDIRVAGTANGEVDLRLDGDFVKSIVIPSTGGWQRWITLEDSLQLPSGRHKLTLGVLNGGFNLNWIDIITEREVEIVDLLSSKVPSSVRLFPNPTSRYFSVHMENAERPTSLEIRNMGGQVVWKFSKAFGRDLIHLDLNGLSSGVYLVYISSEDSIKEVQKLIIK